MLASTAYAENLDLFVDTNRAHRLELELADRSTRFTSGIMRDVTWKIGLDGEEILYDFYILNDLAVDLVLSNPFLFEMDVFERYESV